MILNSYRAYWARQRSLSDAAYFSLTVLEDDAGGRQQASERFGIDIEVLRMIGLLTSKKGGKEARKGSGAQVDFLAAERTWLEETLKMLLRRTAEVAFDPKASKNKLRMADLPPL